MSSPVTVIGVPLCHAAANAAGSDAGACASDGDAVAASNATTDKRHAKARTTPRLVKAFSITQAPLLKAVDEN
jgi:hypothetical protein